MKQSNRSIPAGNPRIGWCCSGFGKILSLRQFQLLAICLPVVCAFATGCSPEPQFRANSLEWVKQEKSARLEAGEHFDPIHQQDVADVMTAWFGTPDQPFFPYVEGEDDPAMDVIAPQALADSAGAVSSDRADKHQGLYREHCAHCHGISGDGAGPTASFLDPYPRDFRLGKFKFKNSPTGTPPSKDDLRKILINGIPGTAMPSFKLLEDDELNALTDYVIYLSNRGGTERLLIGAVKELGDDYPRLVTLPKAKRLSDFLKEAKGEVDEASPTADEEESDSDSSNADEDGNDAEDDDAKDNDAEDDGSETSNDPIEAPDEIDTEVVTEELEYMYEDYMLPVLEKWIDAMDYEAEVPEVPQWINDSSHGEYQEKITLGQKLYFGQANCKQCHGETGVGDGQTNNYDDWTNDWLQVESLNPEDLESIKEYLAAGALPPRPILPRNLRMGVYRGGDQPQDLFLRIRNGIEGTPMPATLTLNDDEIWALVAYVRQLPYESISRPATSKKTTNNDKPVR